MTQNLTTKRRVLSGMRPTGRLHLGNYMGALYNWVRLQHEYDCFFFIADIHALTTDYADPSRVKQNTMEIAIDFLAAGLDPDQCTIFLQSRVPQHAELNLLFSMFTPLGWLERVPTYKDQKDQLKAKDLNTYGFLGYPLLQSADILLYTPDFVPVGQDQVAHVELTREVARRFNQFYGRESFLGETAGNISAEELLPEPKVLLTPAPKLPGLDGRKMSKSYGNYISMSDEPATIEQKVLAMSNGGQRANQSDPGNPDRCPVGQTHAVFSTPEVIERVQSGCRNATLLCHGCKVACSAEITLALAPILDKRRYYEANPGRVIEILEAGSAKARSAAEQTMAMVREAMGIGTDLHTVRIDHPVLQTFRNASPEGVLYDLTAKREWWDQPSPLRARSLRQFWLDRALPSEIYLKEQGGRDYLTEKSKRVSITTSRETRANIWSFKSLPKTYEVLVLLCWGADLYLRDFVVPQKVYVEWWTAEKKKSKKQEFEFSVVQTDKDFFLQIGASDLLPISPYRSDYRLLS